MAKSVGNNEFTPVWDGTFRKGMRMILRQRVARGEYKETEVKVTSVKSAFLGDHYGDIVRVSDGDKSWRISDGDFFLAL